MTGYTYLSISIPITDATAAAWLVADTKLSSHCIDVVVRFRTKETCFVFVFVGMDGAEAFLGCACHV